MTVFAYLNGCFVPESEAMIRIDDGGWLHGAGLFETMRAERGRVFRYRSHMERLGRSASKLLAPLASGTLPDASIVEELLARNGLGEARVRLTVSAGPMRSVGQARQASLLVQSVKSPQGMEEDRLESLSHAEEAPNPTICVTVSALAGYPQRLYESGVRAALCDFRLSPTDPTAGHKTTGALPRLLALREAQRVGCFEALWFTTANRLAEGSISNVFVVQKGVLKTPPLDTPVLPGIARGVVCEIARKVGLEVSQSPLTIDDLLDADEAMLTNVILQVMPLVRVEERDIGDGCVGPIARQLLDEYHELVRKECPPS